MRKLIYGMNVSVDGYIAALGDDINWSDPSDALFHWWLEQEQEIELFLYGRKLWESMSSYWPTGDLQPNASPDEIAFAQNWRDTPKIVFSSTTKQADWNTQLFHGDTAAEMARLKSLAGGPMRVGGAQLAGTAMRADLVDEYTVVTHPVLVGGGAPFFAELENWAHLDLLETLTFPKGVVMSRYAVRR